MTPELSRRVARVLQRVNPDLKVRARVVEGCREANTFDDLPVWLQRFVVEAEKADKPDPSPRR